MGNRSGDVDAEKGLENIWWTKGRERKGKSVREQVKRIVWKVEDTEKGKKYWKRGKSVRKQVKRIVWRVKIRKKGEK